MMNQKGFTLIELMIAITLGLIITAAAVGIYIANYRTLSNQKSSSEMQSASMFGIQPLESRLRLANLGNPVTSLTNTTADGGVVLSTANAPSVTDANLLSRTAVNASNTATNNDQLTIQFVNSTPFSMYDCEGEEIPINGRSIERYFVRSGTNGLSLACDAGKYTGSSLSGFGDDGVELISDVDLFRFLLGVQSFDASGNVVTQFYTVRDYLNIAGDKPAIVSIKAGVIARGSTPTSGESLTEFTLLGDTETLNSSVNKKVARNTFETTTLLRNARVTTFVASEPEIK